MLSIYVDGAVRVSNPGVASCAWVMYNDKGDQLHSQSYYLGPERSNNFAEYSALIKALEWLYEHNTRNVLIHSDSQLVVEQTNQRWEVKTAELRPLMSKAYGLLVQGAHVLKHCKGHDGNIGNEKADELCNLELDAHKEEYEKQTT